jgi:hypothetical protein
MPNWLNKLLPKKEKKEEDKGSKDMVDKMVKTIVEGKPPEGAEFGKAIRFNYYITPQIPEKDQPKWRNTIILKTVLSKHYKNVWVYFNKEDKDTMRIKILCDEPTFVVTPNELFQSFIKGIFKVVGREVIEKALQDNHYKIEGIFYQTMWRYKAKNGDVAHGVDKDVESYSIRK